MKTLILALLLTASCFAQVKPLISTYLGDGQRNYYGNAAPSKLRVKWKLKLGGGNTRIGRRTVYWKGAGWTGQPLVIRENGVEYLIQGTLGHTLKKIRARDGRVIWSTNVGDVIKGTPTFVDTGAKAPNRYVLITGSRMGKDCNFVTGPAYSLHGISYQTGGQLWKYSSIRTSSNSRDVDASALMIGSKACVPLENGYFTILSPSVAKAKKINGVMTPKIYRQTRLYRESDRALYRQELSCEGSPTLYRGRAYVAAGCGRVYSISSGFGGIGWTLDVGGDLNSTMPLTSDNHLLLGVEKQFISGQGGVMKIKPGGGVQWYFPMPNVRFYEWRGGVVGSAAVNHRTASSVPRDMACFVGVDGTLTVVNHKLTDPNKTTLGPRNKNRYPLPLVLDQVKLPKGSISTPLFINNRIVVGYDNGMDLYEVSKTGKLRRLARLSGVMFDATPVVWNRRIYAGSKNGYLYCLGD